MSDNARWEELRLARFQDRTRKYGEILAGWSKPLGFELITPDVDRHGQAVFGQWGGWVLGISEMIPNERLVLWREQDVATRSRQLPVYGWCYPKWGHALMALMTFDPATMGEPAGYTKRAHGGVREPGETAEKHPGEDWAAAEALLDHLLNQLSDER